VLASSHIDRVTASSVYGKRLPFSGSEELANSFDHMIRLRPKGNANKDGGARDRKRAAITTSFLVGFEDEDDDEDENEAACEAKGPGDVPGF